MKNVAILLFLLSVPLALWAKNITPCETVFSDPESFAQAMTENLILRKGQDILLELYLKAKTSNPNAKDDKTLQSVYDVLNQHPELSKLALREQILEFPITQREYPESLNHFIRSFRNSAGQIRNSLFQVEENLGFWMKMLGFSTSKASDTHLAQKDNQQTVTQPLSPTTRRQGLAQKGNQQTHPQTVSPTTRGFIEWLNTTALNQETRNFIKDESKPYRDRVITLYKAMEQIKSQTGFEQGATSEGFSTSKQDVTHEGLNKISISNQQSPQNQQVLHNLSQAMANLIHTAGFGNKAWVADLKSKDPSISFLALRNILNERDIIAFELGFEGHFKELKTELNSKILDETNQLQQITKEIENKPSVTKGAETLRLRPLSLIESPFRGCFGGDCSTRKYFEKGLDPNFLYFTLTDGKHRSFGQITLVLGTAQNEKGQEVKTAFLDKIQDVRPDRIKAMLEGIRLTLKEHGYVLAIPKEKWSHIGLANEDLISRYVQQEIRPHFTKQFTNFKPHKNKYNFDRGYSRAEDNLLLYQFEGMSIKGVNIQEGKVHPAKLAHPNLNVRSLYDPILKLEKSTKEEDQLKFLSHLLNMKGIKELNISNQYVIEHLNFVMRNQDFSFKVRKKAFYVYMEFKWYLGNLLPPLDIAFLAKQGDLFSEGEQKILIGEMSNWKNTTNYRKSIIEKMSENEPTVRRYLQYFKQALESPYGVLLDKNIMLFKAMSQRNNFYVQYLLEKGADPNAKNKEGWTALSLASIYGETKMVQMLLERGAKPNAEDKSGRTALMFASGGGHIEIVRILLERGANLDNKDNLGVTALMVASMAGRTKIAKMLLEKEVDPNTQDRNGLTALMWASQKGHTETVKALLERGADPNAKDNKGWTALILASRDGYTETVKALLERGADPNVKSNSGMTALMFASQEGHTETVQMLKKKPIFSIFIPDALSNIAKQIYTTVFGNSDPKN